MTRLLSILLLALAWPALAATTTLTNSGTFTANGWQTNSVTNGMVLWLPMHNITWTGANATNLDLSGNANHGGLLGGLGNLTNAFRGGPRGAALYFPLTTDYIQCGSGTTLDDIETQGGGGMSVAFWLYVPAHSSASIMAKGASGGRWVLSFSSSSYPYGLALTKSCATVSYVETFAGMLFTNRWQHIVLTWDGGVVTNSAYLYVDGRRYLSTSVITGTGGKNSDAANNFTVGGTPGSTTFAGTISSLRIYNRVVTAAEVAKLYGDGFVFLGTQLSAANAIAATNILSFEGTANGTVIDTSLLGTATKGAALGSWSITGAAADWTVVAESNITTLSPVTVAGTTYSSQTNALACRLATGSSSSLNANLVSGGWGNVSGRFYFKTELRQIAGSGVNFDIFGVGAPSQNGIVQINEGGNNFFVRAHSVSNGVTYTGAGVTIQPYQWYQAAWLWETNAGKYHLWVSTTDDAPVSWERNKLILYSISPIAANSNATYLGPINTPHGTARAGLTNYFKLVSWQYVTATNTP